MIYPKINTIWKRDEKGYILEGDYSAEEFKNIKEWDVSEKIDGMNMRVLYSKEPKIGYEGNMTNLDFRGKTNATQIPPFLLEYMKKTFLLSLVESIFKEAKEASLFGEGYGPKIQKGGGNYRDDVSFILFDVYVDGWWLKREDVVEISRKLGIDCVPYLGLMTIDEAVSLIKNGGIKSKVAKQEIIIEGIVARSHPLVLYRNGNPLMFKLKVKDYLRAKNKCEVIT